MANYAYLGLWFKEFTIEKGLAHLEAALMHFPVSSLRPGFRLVVRSLDQAQSPSLEADLLAAPADVRAAASEYLHDDTVYEVTAHWNLWLPAADPAEESGSGREEGASPVEFLLHGEEFDGGRYREAGHLQVNLSYEQLYVVPSGQSPRDYLRYARENARRLHAWQRAVTESLPVAEQRFWSEGEPEFARRLEETAGAPPQAPSP